MEAVMEDFTTDEGLYDLGEVDPDDEDIELRKWEAMVGRALA